MRSGRSRAPCSADSGGSNWRREERSFWTRWANYYPTLRSRCSGCYRNGNSSESAGGSRSALMFASSLPRIGILKAAVAKGAFRADLYYRLNVFPLEMPPLRVRRADIPLLVEYFVDRYARKAGKSIRSVDKRTLQLLQSYPWPGNIRELQNVIERLVIVCETEIFTVDESWLSQPPLDTRSGDRFFLSEKVAAKEREIIEEALRKSQGRIFGPSGAAARLGIARRPGAFTGRVARGVHNRLMEELNRKGTEILPYPLQRDSSETCRSLPAPARAHRMSRVRQNWTLLQSVFAMTAHRADLE
jgi:hypothetical protein